MLNYSSVMLLISCSFQFPFSGNLVSTFQKLCLITWSVVVLRAEHQNQGNYIDQSQRTQTIKWANHDAAQIQPAAKKGGKNTCDQVTIGFELNSHWLKMWLDVFKPINNRSNPNKRNPQIFNIQIKTAHSWRTSSMVHASTPHNFLVIVLPKIGVFRIIRSSCIAWRLKHLLREHINRWDHFYFKFNFIVVDRIHFNVHNLIGHLGKCHNILFVSSKFA